jgi:hypothetical protein
MSSRIPLDSLLTSHDLQYGVVVGVVAVLVLLLLRRRPRPEMLALFLVGGLLAYLGAPLLEATLTQLDWAVAGSSAGSVQGDVFLRTGLIGVAAAVVGVLCVARAWRESPER